MKINEHTLCKELLQEHGYRVTDGRVALLSFLKHAKKPLQAKDIQHNMEYSMDKVTLYRALEDFSKSKIVAKINLQDVAVYYEFLHTDHHHHHIVCEKCGKLEDIEHCSPLVLEKEILKHSKSFSSIASHSLEFFGVCKACSK